MLKKVNVAEKLKQVKELYVYEKIGNLNEHVLSVVKVENRTLDFHVHPDSDELFYVVFGQFILETYEEKISVTQGEFVIVPKGTYHRPVVTTLAQFVMIELAGTLNKENSGDLYEA